MNALLAQHGGPPDPVNCPKCRTLAWASGFQVYRTCRFCGHTWQVRETPGLEGEGES